MSNPEFIPFPKIARLSREIIITEKIDGTNASVHISRDGAVRAASRTRWITPEDDNHGFAKWVAANAEELCKLGEGAHFGEWWGPGIQRGYGMREKRFSLFNTKRWSDNAVRPACCHVVPVLAICETFSSEAIQTALNYLEFKGSFASPGFMRPEGIVIYHAASNTLFKKTLEKDEEPKSKS